MERVDVADPDLQVDAAPIGVFQRRGPEAATGSVRLLQHQMRVALDDIGERLVPTLERQREAENVDGDGKRCGQIGDVEFGDEWWRGGHGKSIRRGG